MHTDLLEILRCPYCGNRLEQVASEFHESTVDRIVNAIIACECCTFPVVDGIPVMHLEPSASTASAAIQAGNPAAALRAMVGVDDPAHAERFQAAAMSPASTYRDIVESLEAGLEGGYFMYRFSDPTFIVAEAVVHAVAGTVLRGGGRALDVCGGSGHVTRTLVPLSSPPPVLADLFFPKIWLARRFTAPGAIPVCCDANAPLPFARGSFDYAMCSDAFMFIWMKRRLVDEMFRAVQGSARATVLINHTHNQLVWSASHGQALTPSGYRNLFDAAAPHVFGESHLFADVVRGTTLDLTRHDEDAALNREVALTLIASKVERVFGTHQLGTPAFHGGEWRINPLFKVATEGERLHGTLAFPSDEYAEEYAACREYLPHEIFIDAAAYRAFQAGSRSPVIDDLIRRRVIVELPKQYY